MQVNNKLAGTLASDCNLKEEKTSSLQEEAVKFAIKQKFIADSNSISKIIVVPRGNFINIVTKKKKIKHS